MNKSRRLPRLMFISDGKDMDEQLAGIQLVLDAGVEFIQIRWKDATTLQLEKLAEAAKQLCKQYKALCIINDFPMLAKSIDTDGVHLGLEDDAVISARKQLGAHKIIGGTANTLEDVQQRIAEDCDYIGLGPFRFTTTKKKLSPVLGLQGYSNLLRNLDINTTPPIYAIGGITINDVQELRKIGIYGIALSGFLLKNPQAMPQLNKYLYEEFEYSR
ncbi:thiamine phosphate synthase [Sphingobacterium hotanense]|uniref:thiamine phosphate synthase n=1 Tax=Sphingobacterium hotanense TaxID=649196 RepID=UPI0021A6110E|nr:thiamine phosphate synthase [Sphingobacterium hotanense]MCT1525168.1 thiamine phosphate synthase [Sphingobacterium hotanense]